MFESKQAGWWVWLQWVLANAVGTATCFAVISGLGALHETLYGRPTLYPRYTPARESGVLIGAVFVVVVIAAYAVPGAMQWFVLRRLLPRVGWWVLTSALGFLGFAIVATSLFVAISMGVGGRITGLGGVDALEAGAPIGMVVGWRGRWGCARHNAVAGLAGASVAGWLVGRGNHAGNVCRRGGLVVGEQGLRHGHSRGRSPGWRLVRSHHRGCPGLAVAQSSP